jgi:hypothetical protein
MYLSPSSSFFIVLLFISFLFYFLYYHFYLPYSFLSYPKIQSIRYFRCPSKKLGPVLHQLSIDNHWTHSNHEWNLYIPCGYNEVEKELRQITLSSPIHTPLFIFGIPYCDLFVSKNNLWKILCHTWGIKNSSQIQPQSWYPKDIFEYKENLKNGDYFILKKNIQRKQGLYLTNQIQNELHHIHQFVLIQKYIRNTYLIHSYKCNLRIYLIIIMNGKGYKGFYLSKYGKCIYTNKPYNDKDSLDFDTNITSYHYDVEIYKKNPRTFEELNEYIKKDGKNDKKLWKDIYYLFYQLSYALSKHIKPISNLPQTKDVFYFQLFGCDVILDEYLKPYLLELNKGPDMIPKDDIDFQMKYELQKSIFEKLHLIQKSEKESEKWKTIYETK